MKQQIQLPEYYNLMQFRGVVYCPHLADSVFRSYLHVVTGKTAVSAEGLYTLYLMVKQCLGIEGEVWECGVDRGGSAKVISMSAAGRHVRLFDTFCGMPASHSTLDMHEAGDFSETSLDVVKGLVGEQNLSFHVGTIPDTFHGLEDSRIAFAHIDCDLYQSTVDCCEFIYPRLSPRGIMVFDDYSRPSCMGVRKAVDDYFVGKESIPLPNLNTAQAVVFKI